MNTLTVREESVCKNLTDEGYDDLSRMMREKYTREHETFAKLEKVDVDTLYGPRVSEVMRNALKRAIADGNHDEVHAMHNLFQSLDSPRSRDSCGTVPVSRGQSGLFDVAGMGWTFALVFAIPLFAIFVSMFSGSA